MEKIKCSISLTIKSVELFDYEIPSMPLIPRKGEFLYICGLIRENDFTKQQIGELYEDDDCLIVSEVFWSCDLIGNYSVHLYLETELEYNKKFN